MNSNATLKIQENFRKKNSKRNRKPSGSCPESNKTCAEKYMPGLAKARRFLFDRNFQFSFCFTEIKLFIESLILAQDERWRRA